MSKINFTKEHQDRLNALAGEALIKGTVFKPTIGTEVNIYDMFHNLSIGTLQAFNKKLKKEIDDSETDDWTNSETQERKINDLKKRQELVFLMVGFKKSEEEKTTLRLKATQTRAELKALQESVEKPEDKIKRKMEELAALESSLN